MSGAELEAKALHEDMQWMDAPLGELADFEMGQAPPGAECNKEGEGTVFVKAGEFGDLFPVEVEWTTKPLKYGRMGDVFICVVGATAGKLNLGIDCAIGRSVAAIRPRDHVDTKFVYYQLMPWVLKLRAESAGSAQGVISKKQLKEIPFKIVPLAQQKRIVAEIEKQFSRLDEAVANLKRVKANLKRYKAAVLKAAVEGKLTEEWRKAHPDVEPASKLLDRILAERRAKWEEAELAKMKAKGKVPKNDKWKAKYKEPVGPGASDLIELPKGWVWASLGSLGEVIGGLTKNPKRASLPKKLPYLRVANVYANELRLDDIHEIGVDDGELDKLLVKKDDLLIVEGNGSPEQIGRLAIWDGSISQCVHQNHLIKVRLHTECVPEWIVSWLMSPSGRQYVRRVASSTSGLYTLSVGKVSSLPIPLPPKSEQDQIVAEVDRRLSLIDEAESQVDMNARRSYRLRQSILMKAFSGALFSAPSSLHRVSVS